jgi:hypothetical protein
MGWKAALRLAQRLEVCPYCGSGALSALRREPVEADETLERYLLRCGECETWRGALLDAVAVRAVERGLLRERERMARLRPPRGVAG